MQSTAHYTATARSRHAKPKKLWIPGLKWNDSTVQGMSTHACTVWHLRQQFCLPQRSFTALHAHWSLMPCLIKGAIRQQPQTMQVFPMGFTPKSPLWISPVSLVQPQSRSPSPSHLYNQSKTGSNCKTAVSCRNRLQHP